MRERSTSRPSLSGRSTSADVARLAGVSQSAVAAYLQMERQHQPRHLPKSKRQLNSLGTDQTDWPVLCLQANLIWLDW